MTKDFEELFACLRRRNVRAVVVDGYAVAFHGQDSEQAREWAPAGLDIEGLS